MLSQIIPKLPMRNKLTTRDFYVNHLGFDEIGNINFENYLMVKKDHLEIHFFLYQDIDVQTNYGQVYIRTLEIDHVYQELLNSNIAIHPNGKLTTKPWGQREFSILDPDNNLLTFGQSIDNSSIPAG